eukprot:Skav203578  [mRNA]  locus=scaffold935:80468:81274:+ [translate_table: standard]
MDVQIKAMKAPLEAWPDGVLGFVSGIRTVEIQRGNVPVGVKHLSISGQLNVLFHPASPKPPFFAGVTVFFVDPPELDMDFTGAADFVDLPVIRSAVRHLGRRELTAV